MSTSTLATTLIINNTQEISEINTTISNSDIEIPTSGAVYNFVNQLPKSLVVSGNWANAQYAGTPVDPTGLIFNIKYLNGEIGATIPISELKLNPAAWANAGEQTVTFTYICSGAFGSFAITGNKVATVLPPHIIRLDSFQVDTTVTAFNFA